MDYKGKLIVLLNNTELSEKQKAKLEEIFPELKESEDEKIRKALIRFHKSTIDVDGIKGEDIIAWLEKQGEQKPIDYNSIDPYFGKPVDKVKPIFNVGDKIQYSKGWTIMTIEKIENGEYIFSNNMGHTTIKSGNKWYLVEQKPADKVEPKFKVGDWIVYNDNIYQIHNIGLKKYYKCLRIDGTVHIFDFEYIDSKSHLWTIQDAKDGDVLVADNGLAFIYNGYLEKQQWPFAYGGINIYGRFNICDGLLPFTHQKVVPATKEQYDALIKAMTNAGYEWDAEKKELKKIEQTPTLSEEDEKMIDAIYSCVDSHYDGLAKTSLLIWLKSIKDKILPQPKQEWSEEDERTYKSITYSFAHNYPLTVQQQEFVKSLKDRCTWKPSDKQLNNLLDVLSFDNCTLKRRELLKSLYNDLKKLR